MKRSLLFILLVVALVALALAGWTVKGLRRLLVGRPSPVPQPV